MILKPNIAAMTPYVPGTSIPGAEKLSSNENPLGPSPRAVQAIQDTLRGMHRYPDGSARNLREALAEKWSVKAENILISNGSDETFQLLAAAWLAPGNNAVAARETFSEYGFAVQLFDGTMRRIHLEDGGRYPLDGFLDQIDQDTRMVFLCNPNNPTGTYRSHEEVEAFLARVPEDVMVVMDEAYADFADAPDFPNSRILLDRFANVVITRTFSKLYGLAGLRVGYAVAAEKIIDGTSRASMPFNVNILAQNAAQASLNDTEYIQQSLDLVHREKAFLWKGLKDLGFDSYPTQANFLCFDIRRPVAPLWEHIARKGIAVRDLKSFGLPQKIRYTIGRREHNQRLLDILATLPDV